MNDTKNEEKHIFPIYKLIISTEGKRDTESDKAREWKIELLESWKLNDLYVNEARSGLGPIYTRMRMRSLRHI